MKIACASDIHGQFKGLKWPKANVLVLAGDLLPNFSNNKRTDASIQLMYMEDTFVPLLKMLSKIYDEVLVVPGNHDKVYELYPNETRTLHSLDKVHLLVDTELTINGIKFYGSPWTPWFYGEHWVYNLTNNAAQIWGNIPDNTDVLITHGPPHGVLDLCKGGNVGCPVLLERVKQIGPKAHIFGHIHEGYGITMLNNTMYVNASVCTGRYEPSNKIRVINVPDC